MDYNNNSYYILPIEMAAGLNYEVFQEDSVKSVRTNNAGTLFVVEYIGSNPEGTWLTHKQVLEIMQTEEWRSPDPDLNE